MMVRPKPIPINTIVFYSETPGTYNSKVSRGIYLLEISGGGGKAGMSDIISKSVFSGGGGGGGAAFRGKSDLRKIPFSILQSAKVVRVPARQSMAMELPAAMVNGAVSAKLTVLLNVMADVEECMGPFVIM